MSNAYFGIYQGTVTDNNDPEGRGRVTCTIPQVLGGQASPWCTPIFETNLKPNQGSVVWVQFVNGDLTKPVYHNKY